MARALIGTKGRCVLKRNNILAEMMWAREGEGAVLNLKENA